MTSTPHEHDEHGNCIYPLPSWRFSLWDIAGIVLTGVSGLFTVVGQTGNLLSRECQAMANYARQERENREAQQAYEAQQRAIGADLARLVEGDQS